MIEFLSTLQTAWFLGGVAVAIGLEWWWRKRVPYAGEYAWRDKIREELIYIWIGGIALFGFILWMLGEAPPPDPSDYYPE